MKRHIGIFRQDANQGEVLIYIAEDCESYIIASETFKYNCPDHWILKSNYGYTMRNLQIRDEMLRVYLDDERVRPSGFDILINHAELAIQLLKLNIVEFISLDNDLGTGYQEGYTVADYLEQAIITGEIDFVDFRPHTANDVAFQKIMNARRKVYQVMGK